MGWGAAGNGMLSRMDLDLNDPDWLGTDGVGGIQKSTLVCLRHMGVHGVRCVWILLASGFLDKCAISDVAIGSGGEVVGIFRWEYIEAFNG